MKTRGKWEFSQAQDDSGMETASGLEEISQSGHLVVWVVWYSLPTLKEDDIVKLISLSLLWFLFILIILVKLILYYYCYYYYNYSYWSLFHGFMVSWFRLDSSTSFFVTEFVSSKIQLDCHSLEEISLFSWVHPAQKINNKLPFLESLNLEVILMIVEFPVAWVWWV